MGRGMGRAALLALTFLVPVASVWAADATAGRAKSMQCAACHGPNGIATLPDAPNLAGQNALYLAKALKDFKSGARQDETMSLVVGGLSDTDIEDLAAYYESIEITVSPPRLPPDS